MKTIKIDRKGLNLRFKIEKDKKIVLSGLFGREEELSIPYHQVHISGGDRNSHHGAKLYCASESAAAKYVSHREKKLQNGSMLEIVTASENVEITTVFRFFDDVRGFRVYNRVKNSSSNKICLEEVNAFSYLGLGEGTSLNDLFVYLPASSWYVEAQWRRESLFDLRLSNGNNITSMRRLSVGNSGTWSTKEFLPMGIFEDENFSHIFKFDKSKNYAIADVRYANGADDEFVSECVVDEPADMKHFFGYSGWNTTANATGSLMSVAVLKFIAQGKGYFDEKKFKELMFVRLADDWAYQANIRQMLRKGDSRSCSELFKPYISKIAHYLGMREPDTAFYFPWNRTFEIGIVLK